jgi:hypothetical protein
MRQLPEDVPLAGAASAFVAGVDSDALSALEAAFSVPFEEAAAWPFSSAAGAGVVAVDAPRLSVL